MPSGPCPATMEFDFEVNIGDGSLRLWGTLDWDGVSVRTGPNGCDGPLTSLNVRNTSTRMGYAHLPEKKRGDKWVQIPPGTNTSIGPGQRTQAGLETYGDLLGVTLGPEPTFGAPTFKMT